MSVLMDKISIVENIPSEKKDIVMIDEVNGLMPGASVVTTTYIQKKDALVEIDAEDKTTNEKEIKEVFPEYNIVEIVLQSTIMCITALREFKEKNCYLVEINHAKFKSPIMYGDKLVTEVKISKIRGNIVICKAFCKVEKNKVFLGEMVLTVSDNY